MSKFAIVSKVTNEAVIIDEYSAYNGVKEANGCVILTEAGLDTVYVDCYLVKIS